jgi:AcrR family transcriptional regulator
MSPRTKLANQQIRENRKSQILAAASRIFASKGLSATMIEDISAEANVSKGLIYYYFSSKDEVFEALVQQAMEGALALIGDALARPGTPWDRLSWLVEEVLTRARREPEEFMLIVQAYTSQAVPDDVREMAVQYAATISQAMRELIVEGQAAGQVIAGDADPLAIAFTACLQGLALSAAVPIHQVLGSPDVGVVLRMLKS